MSEPDICLNYTEIVRTLDKELPKLPPVPVVVPEDPGTNQKANAFTIGQQPPPEPVDKDKGAKTEKKSGGGGKKD